MCKLLFFLPFLLPSPPSSLLFFPRQRGAFRDSGKELRKLLFHYRLRGRRGHHRCFCSFRSRLMSESSAISLSLSLPFSPLVVIPRAKGRGPLAKRYNERREEEEEEEEEKRGLTDTRGRPIMQNNIFGTTSGVCVSLFYVALYFPNPLNYIPEIMGNFI